MWGFYVDIETNTLIQTPYELTPLYEEPSSSQIHSTMYYIGIIMVLSYLWAAVINH